ncbi:MAG: aldo/keto reductase [Silvibacterium sp.]
MHLKPEESDTRLCAGDRLVLGTWGLGGTWARQGAPLGYGSVSEDIALSVFDAAWQYGIRWVDIASSYGNGQSLNRLAVWQASAKQRFKVALKVGRPIIDGKPASALTIKDITAELELAIRVVGTPDALLIKDPPESSFTREIASLLEIMSDRFPSITVGIASHGREVLKTLPYVQQSQIIQVDYNGTNWIAAAPSAAKLMQKGWTVWAVQPLAYGFLSGKYREDCTFPADDWRSQLPRNTKQVLRELSDAFLSYFSSLRPQVPPAACSIAFCLSDPNVKCVAVGPKTPDQLADSMTALQLLNNSEFQRIAKGLRHTVLQPK